jgi:hypothetical protein
MNVSVALLGAIDWGGIVRRWQTMTPAVRDRVMILSALAFVTLLLVIWAVIFRKRKPDSHSHRHSYDYPRANEGDADAKSHKRRKWRRQRRPHRPLNPTLAQTGGLPPIRPNEPPQSSR